MSKSRVVFDFNQVDWMPKLSERDIVVLSPILMYSTWFNTVQLENLDLKRAASEEFFYALSRNKVIARLRLCNVHLKPFKVIKIRCGCGASLGMGVDVQWVLAIRDQC